MKKILPAFILLFALLSLSLFACEDKKKEPVSVYLESTALASAYEVDEEPDIEKITLKLVYADGKTEDIPCERDMLVGFDTTTTGQRSMYAVYHEMKSNEISYYVYNPEGVSLSVVTPTRLRLTKTAAQGKTIFSFSFSSADITIRALSFTLNSSTEISDSLSELVGTTEKEGDRFFWKKASTSSLRAAVYSPTDLSKGAFFTLQWVSDGNVDVTLSDITVSDGTTDYYLPKVQ